MKFARLYTGDDGQSHFEELDISEGSSLFSKMHPATALVFKNDEKTLRILFGGITSVGLEMIPPGDQEWIVVRFVGGDKQPDEAAFRDANRRSGAGDTGMMLLTLHRARRK